MKCKLLLKVVLLLGLIALATARPQRLADPRGAQQEGMSSVSKRDDSSSADDFYYQWFTQISDNSFTAITYYHTKLVVLPLPSNSSSVPDIWIEIFLRDAEGLTFVYWGINYGNQEDPSFPLWSVSGGIEEEGGSFEIPEFAVNPGDAIEATLQIEGDWVPVNVTVNDQPHLAGANILALRGNLSSAGIGLWTWDMQNCNNLPGALHFTDMIIKISSISAYWSKQWYQRRVRGNQSILFILIHTYIPQQQTNSK
eukprot:TRINITY_DN1603_c0_g1_i2.p1 TRINITY_DN1603_c0_g1~~TRINITY_DN1603_c0_g1_i2.p1  ORF type:complete len:254 (-),score=45.91 TRINITY_DN1603_c0_g1_i2:228-989(-)